MKRITSEAVCCPGCSAPVIPTTRMAVALGTPKEYAIPGHNPLPGNPNNADPGMPCPAVGQIVKGYESPHKMSLDESVTPSL